MHTPEAAQRFDTIDTKLSLEDYNYNHFRTKHYLLDAQGTITSRGLRPGETAPDFELPHVGGGSLRLSDLRGRPVLLHFGSYS
jgi:cytochrome oxidase Cu insertion factor (SCO1/SenC/PrrC family)